MSKRSISHIDWYWYWFSILTVRTYRDMSCCLTVPLVHKKAIHFTIECNLSIMISKIKVQWFIVHGEEKIWLGSASSFYLFFLLSTYMHLKYTLKLEILMHWFQKEIVNTLWNSIKNDLKYILQVQVSLDTWKRLKISGKVSTFS